MTAMDVGGTLLCAIDRDDRGATLVACAREWAGAAGLRPLFVHAVEPARGGADAAGPVRDDLRALGVGEGELRVVTGEAATAVLAAIRAAGPALVLVAAGGADDAVGPTCRAVLGHAAVPVVVVPPGADTSFSGGPIACALSLGAGDEAAVRFARRLATATGRALALANVVGARDAAMLAAARTRRSLAPEARDELSAGALAERLVGVARQAEADALVVASDRDTDARDGTRASVARRLWTRSPCPVVVV
jgi:nucleotide-binding universal stress UspA family protein